jgi:hypothetical protein
MAQGGNSTSGVDFWGHWQGNKSSLLLSFKKEDSSFSEEKEAKRLLVLGTQSAGRRAEKRSAFRHLVRA